jgi:thioredoxin 1
MATTEITISNFESTIKSPGIVLLDWWAPWCGPCRAFGPIFEKVAARHPDIVFGKVNTQEQGDLAGSLNITSIPTLMIIRDGTLIFAQPGMLPEAALEKLIAQARAVDMTAVKEKASGKGRGASAAVG